MSICVEERENHKVVTDEFNPRIYAEYWRCAECKEWVHDEETVWVDPNTGYATTSDKGNPYHEDCAPEEQD